jgi:beta-N-acetylhexosaminidase
VQGVPHPLRLAASAALVVSLGACAGGTTGASPTTSASSSTTGTAATSSSSTTSASTTTTPPATTSTRVMDPAVACARSTFDALSEGERVGQLLMVGLDTNAAPSSLDDEFASAHLGGAILLGGWDGRDKVVAATRHLAGLRTKGVGVLLAADQEGGEVHQLRGDYPTLPSALTQGQWSPAELTARATTLARAVKASGINLNLAPVADTVPADLGRDNEPIGRYGREFSSDPARNGRMATAFIKGMHAGGVLATAKHFPGLGRIRNNTDFNATGITDGVTTANDPYLQPFSAAIEGGVDLVMVGSAIYSRIDPGVNAMFSKRIVTGILREKLGWQGVVITDDVGFAKAVTALSNRERAVRFVEAGGDVVLTADPLDIGPMHSALLSKAGSDPAFQNLVDTAATRVLVLKARNGLLTCR